ncbi:MAG TPA: transcriptional repressor NrdR [Anaerolineae bacterium]|nr:transcriptional repressor NrdR [Anaerolineae bacterium]
MKCPYCGHTRSRVLDTRDSGDGIRRRRLCLNCQKRFTTYEQVSVAVHVIKSDGRREAFDRTKLLNGIRMACAKRPIAMSELEGIVEQIEEYVYSSGQAEIPSKVIGNMVLDRLQEIDPVAYIRFATVYLELPDLDAVQAVIENLVTRSK